MAQIYLFFTLMQIHKLSAGNTDGVATPSVLHFYLDFALYYDVTPISEISFTL